MKALLLEPLGRGAVAQYTYHLACALSRRVDRVLLLTARDSDLLRPPFSLPPGVTLLPHLSPRANPPKFYRSRAAKKVGRVLAYVADAARLYSACARHRPHVAHVQSASGLDAIFLAVLRAAGLPVVFTVHNIPSGTKGRSHQAFYGIVYRLPHRLIAHANGSKHHLLGVLPAHPRRLEVMPAPAFDGFSAVQPIRLHSASWLTIARRTAAVYSEVVSGRVCTNW